MRTVFSVHFDHPVEKVFPYLAQPEKWLEFTPALIERTRLDDGPVRSGSTWRSADRVGLVKVEFTDELVDLEPNRHVKFRQSSPWNSWGEFSIEPDGDGTVLHVHFEGRPSGKIWWLGLVPDRLAVKVYKNDLALLAKILDESD